MPENTENDLKAWQSAFFRLFDWLECDRDRHKAVLSGDHIDLIRVALYIDHHCVSAAGGFEFPLVVAEAMNGMIIPELEGIPVPDEENNA